MMEQGAALDPDTLLQLDGQFRLQWEPRQECYVLLYPEGMVQLQGGAGEIMKRIDGKTTLRSLIEALEAAFPGAELRDDVLDFVGVARSKGWIRAQPAA
jgi:pyrroloquinoline quinone biosynthesis protein D